MDSKNDEMVSVDTAIKYAQVAVYTLQHSATPVDAKSIRAEILMLHNKFGASGIKKLSNIFSKKE